MQLKLGLMKNTELAAWFNITPKTYENARKNYLTKLETFAKFTVVRGGVMIDKIIIDTYIKNIDDDVKLYLQEVKNAEDNITSLTGISEVLCNQEEFSHVSVETMRGRMRRAGEKAFGITVEPESRGLYGSREYVWAIKLYDRPNHYRNFTEQEKKEFDALTEGFYSTSAERIQKEALLERAYREDNSMTKEEYFKKKEELGLDTFSEVIWQFKIRTGLQIVHATAHEIDQEYMDSARYQAPFLFITFLPNFGSAHQHYPHVTASLIPNT